MEWASVFPSGRSDDPVVSLVSGLTTRAAPSLRGGAPAHPPRLVLQASLVMLVAIGCVGGGGATASSAPSVAPGTLSSQGSGSEASPAAASSVPAAMSGTPSPAARSSAPTTTETVRGRIWDTLPAGFPIYPGAGPADTGEGPASALLDVPATTAKVVAWYGNALARAGYTIEASGGPLEDGSTVIDAAGADPACRVQVTIVPHGPRSAVTILMAAACPFR